MRSFVFEEIGDCIGPARKVSLLEVQCHTFYPLSNALKLVVIPLRARALRFLDGDSN